MSVIFPGIDHCSRCKNKIWLAVSSGDLCPVLAMLHFSYATAVTAQAVMFSRRDWQSDYGLPVGAEQTLGGWFSSRASLAPLTTGWWIQLVRSGSGVIRKFIPKEGKIWAEWMNPLYRRVWRCRKGHLSGLGPFLSHALPLAACFRNLAVGWLQLSHT